jgi:hypothetical protein
MRHQLVDYVQHSRHRAELPPPWLPGWLALSPSEVHPWRKPCRQADAHNARLLDGSSRSTPGTPTAMTGHEGSLIRPRPAGHRNPASALRLTHPTAYLPQGEAPGQLRVLVHVDRQKVSISQAILTEDLRTIDAQALAHAASMSAVKGETSMPSRK